MLLEFPELPEFPEFRLGLEFGAQIFPEFFEGTSGLEKREKEFSGGIWAGKKGEKKGQIWGFLGFGNSKGIPGIKGREGNGNKRKQIQTKMEKTPNSTKFNENERK